MLCAAFTLNDDEGIFKVKYGVPVALRLRRAAILTAFEWIPDREVVVV